MTRDAITGRIDKAIGQNTRNPCFLCPNASAKPAPSADQGWLIASGWFGFDFTIKRPAGFLAALDASSVKPMWREIGAFVSKWPTETIQAAPCYRT